VSARSIAEALGGKRSGEGWVCRCPSHNDRNPSLSIKDADNKNGLIVNCFAGCNYLDVIDSLKARGLLEGEKKYEPSNTNKRNSETALNIWRECFPIEGSLAEGYLRGRALLPPYPTSLRFHPHLFHSDSSTNCPALVAAICRWPDKKLSAITRTFLSEDGKRKADVAPNKMSLGPCSGGAVRLAPVDKELLVCEGVETALSVQQLTGTATWAAIGTSGLKTLNLPDNLEKVTIAGDNDEAGRKAAEYAKKRWKNISPGLRVHIVYPDKGDWNDALRIATDANTEPTYPFCKIGYDKSLLASDEDLRRVFALPSIIEYQNLKRRKAS
jgi:putative DNA primase/helicase|tara:strand:+ start:1097 stop:2077 length:981 start_codon:yes stop_codon:yes gene_type:complete